MPKTFTVLIPSGVALNDAIDYYKSFSEVKWAVRDWIYFQSFEPNDPIFTSWPTLPEYGQRHLTNTNFDDAWDFEQGSKEIVVGIIEAGFDYTHEDLRGNLWINRGEDLNGNGLWDPGIDHNRTSGCGTIPGNNKLDSWEDDNGDGLLQLGEDKNGNNKLDTSEDINNNGRYDPFLASEGGDLDGIDNDMNGKIDDVVGYAFDESIGTFEPEDLFDHNPTGGAAASGHGTAVSGIIGAVGNNNKGVAGTNIQVSLMLLNSGHSEGGHSRDAGLDAMCYAIDNGARVINHSYGYNWQFELDQLPQIDPNDPYLGVDFSSEIEHFEHADNAGILSVAAAGNGIGLFGFFSEVDPFFNDWFNFMLLIWPKWYESGNFGKDNGILSHPGFYPELPASFPFDTIISVAATDHGHRLVPTTNFGADSVDVAAPGWSTFVATTYPTAYSCRFDVWRFSQDEADPNYGYGFFSGTSSAAPHVSGIAALVLAVNPDLTALEVKDIILSTVQPLNEMYLWGYLEDVGFEERLFSPDSKIGDQTLVEYFGEQDLLDIVDILRNNEYMNRERTILTNGEIDAYAAVLKALGRIEGENPKEVTVSLDGSTLAFLTSDITDDNLLGGQSLTLMRSDGSCIAQFPTCLGYCDHTGPSITMFGDKVAYVEHLPGFLETPKRSVIRVATFTYDPINCFQKIDDVQLTPSTIQVSGESEAVHSIQPAISPEGDWVVYSSDVGGNYDIYVERTDGSTAEAIKISHDYEQGSPRTLVDYAPSTCWDARVITWLGSYADSHMIDPVTVVKKVNLNGYHYVDEEIISPQNLTKSGPVVSYDCLHVTYAGSEVFGGEVIWGPQWLFQYHRADESLTTLYSEPTYVSSSSQDGNVVPFLKGSMGDDWSLSVVKRSPYEVRTLIPEDPNNIGVIPSCYFQEDNEWPYTDPTGLLDFDTPLPLCEHAIDGDGTMIYFIGRDVKFGADNIYQVPSDWDPTDPNRVNELVRLTHAK